MNGGGEQQQTQQLQPAAAEEEGWCPMLEVLPPELLCTIFSFVVNSADSAWPRHLAAWCLTCATFNNLCDDEMRYHCRCFAASPVLFSLALSPLFDGSPHADQARRQQVKLSWRMRAQLMSHLPRRLTGRANVHMHSRLLHGDDLDALPRENEVSAGVVDSETGREHTNRMGGNHSLIADHPFLCTNREALLSAFNAVDRAPDEPSPRRTEEEEEELLKAVMFRGVDYFEMTVVRNTVSYNRAAAIAIAQWFDFISFLGWTHSSIAWHSDDGTIRGGTGLYVETFDTFSTGDVVGCGVDWDADEVFFVLSSPPSQSEPHGRAKVRLSKRDRERTPWYPAIGSMMPHDVLRVNFGHEEPFVFDIKNFVEKKRAGQLHLLHDVLVSHGHAS